MESRSLIIWNRLQIPENKREEERGVGVKRERRYRVGVSNKNTVGAFQIPYSY
jgi:hypothetical protein